MVLISAIAAAVMLQGTTAHYLTHSTFPLKAGDTCLVHAAAGGTGGLIVQMAKHLGARVFGTVSSDEKARQVKTLGADAAILYTTQDFETEVKRLTDGRGVDVVYDSVGKTTFDKSLNVLRPRGTMALFGQSSGSVPPFDPGRSQRARVAFPDAAQPRASCARSQGTAVEGWRRPRLRCRRHDQGARLGDVSVVRSGIGRRGARSGERWGSCC